MPSRDEVEQIFDAINQHYNGIHVLYGGSVNENNSTLFTGRKCDGLLVGGASLNASSMIGIYRNSITE